MAEFRTKPVVKQAWQYNGGPIREGDPDWVAEATEPVIATVGCSAGAVAVGLNIKTLEGTMRADVGDWIIRGIKGEVYPCKPDIFAATYEPADPSPDSDSPYPPGFAAMVNTLADLKHDPEEAEAILAAWPAVLEFMREAVRGDMYLRLEALYTSLPTEIKKLVEGE